MYDHFKYIRIEEDKSSGYSLNPTGMTTGSIMFPIRVSAQAMVDDEFNYRKSEAKAYLNIYLDKLKEKFKLPENYTLKWIDDSPLLSRAVLIERPLTDTPSSAFNTPLTAEWQKFREEWGAEKNELRELFEQAHSDALWEMGEPEIHTVSGINLRAGMSSLNYRNPNNNMRGKISL